MEVLLVLLSKKDGCLHTIGGYNPMANWGMMSGRLFWHMYWLYCIFRLWDENWCSNLGKFSISTCLTTFWTPRLQLCSDRFWTWRKAIGTIKKVSFKSTLPVQLLLLRRALQCVAPPSYSAPILHICFWCFKLITGLWPPPFFVLRT